MPSEIKVSAATLRIVTRLSRVVDPMPSVFPTPDTPLVRPLAVGIRDKLHERVKPPDDMSVSKAHAIVADALKNYARSAEYRAAVAMSGAWRFDLDGNPVEPVAPEHADFARKIKEQPVGPTKETISVKIQAMKVTIVLQQDQIRVIPETLKTVDLAIDLGDGRSYVAPFSGKNWRRARRQIDDVQASGGEAVVVLQGRLIAGGKIEGAGLAVQVKTPKPDAAG